MKKIAVKYQKQFVEGAIQRITAAGAILIEPEFETQTYQQFRFEGKNPITFTVYPVGHHDVCFDVFARYERKNSVSGLSGKYNFHQGNNLSMDKILILLEIYLDVAIKAVNE